MTESEAAEKSKTKPEDDEYDPYLYREVENPTKNWETLIHLLKGCIGTGILAIPEGFKYAGMFAIVSTLLIGLLVTYCFHILIKGQYIMCKKLKIPLLTYPESMRVACEMGPSFLKKFGPYAPALTDFFLVFYQIGTCCIYVIFVGVNLKKVGDLYTSKELGLYIYILIILIPFALIMCVRNLKLFAPFSTLANLVTLVTFGVICYYVFQDLKSFTERPIFGSFMGVLLYFGTSLFGIQSVAVIVALENNMANPRNFRQPFGVLNIGMAIVTITFTAVGMMGYWKYGEDIEPSITMNFPTREILAQIILITYCLSIFFTYGLQGIVGVNILWTNYIVKRLVDASDRKKMLLELVLRICTVILTFVLATTVPLLGLFISLVGSFSLGALVIVFPALVDICAYWPEKSGPKTWIFWKDIVLIIIGLFGLFMGSYSSIKHLVIELKAKYGSGVEV